MTWLRFNVGSMVVLFLIMLAGCSSGDAGKIMGTWEISNADSISERVGPEGDLQSESEMIVQFVRGGQLITRTKIGSIDSEKTGTWTFQSYDPSTSQMKIECSLQGQTTQHEIEFVNEDSIKWIPPNMAGTTKRLVFVRGR